MQARASVTVARSGAGALAVGRSANEKGMIKSRTRRNTTKDARARGGAHLRRHGRRRHVSLASLRRFAHNAGGVPSV